MTFLYWTLTLILTSFLKYKRDVSSKLLVIDTLIRDS